MSTIFVRANQYLRLGKYAEAIELYRQALQQQPALGSSIRFNMGLAEKKLHKSSSYRLILPLKPDTTLVWVSHASLQNCAGDPCILLGGMLIGYPTPCDIPIPGRLLECARLYVKIAQIQDFHSLRLRHDDQLVQPSCNESVGSPAEFVHSFEDPSVGIFSAWYANSRDLRMTIESQLGYKVARVLRAYQYDPAIDGGLTLVGECLLHPGEQQLTDLALVNPYLPIFLTLASIEGHLTDASLIPYPSLLPGGIHEYECHLDQGDGADAPQALARTLLMEHLRAVDPQHGWALGHIQVDIREALGSETILSADFKEWLWSLFSLRIKPWRFPELSQSLVEYWQEVFTTPSLMRTAERFSTQTAREREGRTLLCPPRAIPSLRAITASRAVGPLEQTCGVGGFILIQEKPYRHAIKLSWPVFALNDRRVLDQDGALRIPMLLMDKGKVAEQDVRHPVSVSAILIGESTLASSTQLIMPTAPDCHDILAPNSGKYTVDVVITANGMSQDLLRALLESIQQQQRVQLRQVVLVLASDADKAALAAHMERLFADCYALVSPPAENNYKSRVQCTTAVIKDLPDDAYMVLINQPLLLHDPRTLARLAQTLAIPKAVTATPLLIGQCVKKSKPEIGIRFSGVFPIHSQDQTDSVWSTSELATALPRTTLPVASPCDAIFMIKAKDWKKSRGYTNLQANDEMAVHEYAARLMASKKLHLLDPHVSVELHTPANSAPPHEIAWTPPHNLDSQSTVLHIEVLPS